MFPFVSVPRVSHFAIVYNIFFCFSDSCHFLWSHSTDEFLRQRKGKNVLGDIRNAQKGNRGIVFCL